MKTLARLFVVWMLLGVAGASAAESFTLWQLPSQTGTHMMSYVLRTPGGQLLVLDGGNQADASYLRGFLGALGNSVQAWFISHPHPDHVGALLEILANPQGLTIDTLYGSPLEEGWVARHLSRKEDHETIRRFREAFTAPTVPSHELVLGEKFTFDGVQVQVLGVRNPELTQNPVNNSSVVLKVWDAQRSVLFLGDLGSEGGEKLLRGPYAAQLQADVVQVAHHGQQGVGEAVYQAIAAQTCLWPTPQWLWDVDPSKGKDPSKKGTGHWKTLETRAWMAKLNVQRHYLSAKGLQRID